MSRAQAIIDKFDELRGDASDFGDAPSEKDFEKAFDKFMKGAQKKVDDHYKQSNKGPEPGKIGAKLSFMKGRRYRRVVIQSGLLGHEKNWNQSVYCFVDKTNGDVLKAAGWKTPAKGKRSSIYDADSGLGGVDAYGGIYR